MDEHESRQHGGAQMDSIDGQGVDDDAGSSLDTSTSGAGTGTVAGTGMGSGAGMSSGVGSGMSSGSGMTSGAGRDLGGDGDLEGSGDGDTGSDLASGLGNATPGAGSNWTPGRPSSAGSSTGSTDAIVGGEDTERASGSWGNRSGSGSGGQGEAEMAEEGTRSGSVSEDVTGSAGTNG